MTRAHRRWHLWIWLLLGPAVLLAVGALLANRPAVVVPTDVTVEQER